MTSNPDWTDYVQTVAAVLAAVGTVGAVLVALYWPGIMRRRTRPAVTLEPSEHGEASVPVAVPVFDREGNEVDSESWASSGLGLAISNDDGRDTASNVQLYATVRAHKPQSIRITQKQLTWESGLYGQYGKQVLNIPPGVTRRIGLLYIGDGRFIAERHHQTRSLSVDDANRASAHFAALAVFPARNDFIHWLELTMEYDVELVLAGDNFDAQTYRGVFTVTKSDGGQYAKVTARWLTRPAAL